MSMIGVVATNQDRKSWGFVAQLCEQIIVLHPDVTFWWHVDRMVHKWNLHALIEDFNLREKVMITLPPVSDQWLATQYKQCAMTLLPSTGEGWGYPIFESFACDIPCLHTNYAGGASIMQTCGLQRYLVGGAGDWRIEGQYNCLRPVLALDPWLYTVGRVLREKREPGELSACVEHLRWGNLAGRWLSWFKDGIAS